MRFLKYFGVSDRSFSLSYRLRSGERDAGFYSDIAGSRDAGSGDGNHRSGQED